MPFYSVDSDHELYYETHGELLGIPLLFMHGGPGLGFSEKDISFFDLNKYFLILLDQRGSGKSRPPGKIESNTTWDLIGDIEKLLNVLNINEVIIFGGSWGSALSLVFAINYPNRVIGLILRGIFLATSKNVEHLNHQPSKKEFLAGWNRYSSMVKKTMDGCVLKEYHSNILSPNMTIVDHYAFEMARYMTYMGFFRSTESEIEDLVRSTDYQTRMRILTHYAVNNFFLPEGYILEHLDPILDIPMHIVHGNDDFICPKRDALKLSERIPHASLHLIDAGHSPHEPQMYARLVNILENWS